MTGEWQVRLLGNPADLSRLALVTSARFAIRATDTGYIMCSASFSGTAADVKAAADAMLPALSATLRLYDESAEPLSTASVVKVCDGAVSVWIFATPATAAARVVAPAVRLGGVLQLDDDLEADLDVSLTHPDARRAVEFFAAGTWVDLYKAFEVIRDAVGGSQVLRSRGWVSSHSTSRFTQTANFEQRHATGVPAPRQPMSMQEGRRHVSELLRAWFAELRRR